METKKVSSCSFEIQLNIGDIVDLLRGITFEEDNFTIFCDEVEPKSYENRKEKNEGKIDR
jgi:hypothetical protein